MATAHGNEGRHHEGPEHGDGEKRSHGVLYRPARGLVNATRRLFDFLVEELAGRASVYKEDPLALRELDSEPEPDALVCSNPDLEVDGTDATTPLLVVEIADSSLRADLGVKASLYAEAKIPECWVVNLVREPSGGVYRKRRTLKPDARVAPASWPDAELEVASLLPDALRRR